MRAYYFIDYMECCIIDILHHYGYEANKRHLNQAGFVPPTKFVNIFVLDEVLEENTYFVP